MASQTYLGKMKARKDYRNFWHTGLMGAVAVDPCYCCFALLCPPCASCRLRKRALSGDMSRYKCCGGYMACCCCSGDHCCCACCCLCMEVCLCFPFSVAATRFILQDEFNIQTTKCDNCIIGCMDCLQLLSCICSIVDCISGTQGSASSILCCLQDALYCLICVCMQTQHKIEMDKRDGKFPPPQPPPPVTAAPPSQQMSRIDQPVPPSVGCPRPPAYGQPYVYPAATPPPPAYGQPYVYPAAAAPPQTQAYPPAGYPPYNYPPAGFPR